MNTKQDDTFVCSTKKAKKKKPLELKILHLNKIKKRKEKV
jgi:hypothetical protein